MSDRYNLERFVDAQDSIIDGVRAELQSGQKRSHWMWFIFPQVRGLGQSETAREYAISSRDEAKAYLDHPVLGPRLRDCSQLVVAVQGRSMDQIFGYPDNVKFRSSMTLFAEVSQEGSVFHEALDKYFNSQPDDRTLQLLGI